MKDEMFKGLCLAVRQATEHARRGTTTLSDRDRDRFLETLKETEPNEALREAVEVHNGEVAESV
jgi:uncharacterized protein (DUF1778 family)